MQANFDKFLSRSEAELLSNPELARLARSSEKYHALFQPLLKERKLLHYVLRGNLDEVRSLLAQDPNLLKMKTRGTDLSGLTFDISTRDYMLWALDKFKFRDILCCLPQTEKGNQVLDQLCSQYADSAHQLLLHVVRGEHDAVRALLTEDMSLLSKKSSVIDLSGRVFEEISPFEYALWALDSHMWKNMLACIPENEQGKKVLGELRSQCEALRTKGVTYKLNRVVITEPHFNFQNTIIKALQTQIDLFTVCKAADNVAKFSKAALKYSLDLWMNMLNEWIIGVGSAQRLLPAHIVHEYCSTRAFMPIPDFNTYPEASKKYTQENWFSNKIGSTDAIDKGDSTYCYETKIGASYGTYRIEGDLAAMKALCKVRTQDFNHIATLLGITVPVEAPEQEEKPQSTLTVNTAAEVDDRGYESYSPMSPGSSGDWSD